MNISRNIFAIPAILLVAALAACSTKEAAGVAETAQDTFTVTVSIPPQKYFLERIGGGRVQVNVMVPPGGNPHSYEPTPQQMKELSRSQGVFQHRGGF